MDFGIFIPQGWRLDLVGIEPAQQWPLIKRLAQGGRRGAVDVAVGVRPFPRCPRRRRRRHEAWTLMSAFAASTERIRLGQMCTCIAYRNPAYLAKVATTVDHVSGGRVEMGIGAGWYEHEWLAYGYGFPSAGDRLRALDEGVQIFTQAWREGNATLDGKVYQVDRAIVQPLPLQDNGFRCGSPVVANARPCLSPRSTPSTPTSTAPPTALPTSRPSSNSTPRTSAATSPRSPAPPTTTW